MEKKEKKEKQSLVSRLTVIALGLAIAVLAFVVATALYDTLSTKDDPFLYSIHYLRVGADAWDWLAFVVALMSLIITSLNTFYQRRTERNTSRVDDECQRQILLDLARHFYCNLIVVCALEAKLRGRFDKYYPSEEHLDKLKMSLDPQIFRTQSKKFKSVHELMVLLRNFNSEIDVIKGHLSSPEIFAEAKRRDFATLRFKMDFLTKRIAELMEKIWGHDYKAEIAAAIRNAAELRNGKYMRREAFQEAALQWDHAKPFYANKESFYHELFGKEEDDWKEFVETLNTHIFIEMTHPNNEGGEKLFFIPFDPSDGPMQP